MPSRSRESRALLLRSVDYRDSDRIVTLLTEDFGKISVLARGARKSQRRFGGALQPYVLMNACFRPGRGELAHLDRVSVDRSFSGILRSLSSIGAAGAALALIRERVPDHEPEPAVFETAVRFLAALDQGVPVEEALLSLQIRVLTSLGFAPTLDRCVHCGKMPAPGRAASFDAARGGIVCRACGGGRLILSAGALRRWHAVQATSDIPEDRWPERERQQIHDALAQLDAHHATVTVRERTATGSGRWEGRIHE
ncbi:MAG TPA: DNA repair protein RecO [Polyangiales bacterium]|nr:DNA repair protein RecO [Polyangiales bacterium]